MGKITIEALKDLSKKYNLDHVIVFATEGKTQHIATYGKTMLDCDQAAQYGDKLKDAMGWPESLHAMPNRVAKLQKLGDETQKCFSDLQKSIAGLREAYPRAFKLMDKSAIFLVIADHEPYFTQAYSMIRENEIKQGTWTDEDQYIYECALLSETLRDLCNGVEGSADETLH